MAAYAKLAHVGVLNLIQKVTLRRMSNDVYIYVKKNEKKRIKRERETQKKGECVYVCEGKSWGDYCGASLALVSGVSEKEPGME